MKKKLVCLALCAIMLLSCFIPFTVQAAGITDQYPELTEDYLKNMEAYTLPVLTEEVSTLEPAYFEMGPDTTAYMIPVECEATGYVAMNMQVEGLSEGGSLAVTVYTDETLTKTIGSWTTMDTENVIGEFSAYLQKGRYYVFIEKSETAVADNLRLGIVGALSSAAQQTLTQGKTIYGSINQSQSFTYYKFKAEKDGVLQLSADSNMYVLLCSSKKVAVSQKEYLDSSNGYTTSFGVRKGITYYLKVSSASQKSYALTYKIIARSLPTNTTKSKAITLKSGAKATTCVIPSTTSTKQSSYWYKFTLSKNAKVRITTKYTTGNNGSLYCEIIPVNSKMVLYGSSYTIWGGNAKVVESDGTLPKGTYYIKVTRKNPLTSGAFAISFK